MDLVHDIHPAADGGGRVDRLVPEGTYLVHAVVGGRVQLYHIQNGAAVDARTGGTGSTGIPLHRALTVDRFGQDLGAGGLSRAPCSGEQVGVRKPVLPDLILQGFGDM